MGILQRPLLLPALPPPQWINETNGTTEVLMWLKCINRRMLATPKARDPWCIEIKRDLPQEIFSHIKDAIRKGVSAFGVSVEDSVVKFTHRKGLFHD